MKKLIQNNKLKEEKEDKPFEINSFDDLVFEHRNREYGAYQLRRKYYRVLFGGVIFSSFIGILAVLIPFLARPREDRVISGGGGYSVSVKMENLTPPDQIYVPPAPPPPEGTKVPETVQYVPPVVVDTVLPSQSTQVATDIALASQENVIPDGTGSGYGDSLIPGGDGSGSEEPLFLVEVMPTFKGGDLSKFREWVAKRTNYPAAAMENKIRGTVFLTFIVEKDGSVSNVTVLKGVHPLLDEEAVKAISDSPKWSPGLQRGQPVRVRFQIPLTFQY